MNGSNMQTLSQFKYLQPYAVPSHYFGETYENHFVFLSQTRDSDSLTRSNFEVALKRLREVENPLGVPDTDEETVKMTSASHWACGWIETIYIHESDTAALELAEEMLRQISQYPVLDEEHWDALKDKENGEWWDNTPVEWRLDMLRDWKAEEYGVSLLQARHKWNNLSFEARDIIEQHSE